MDTKIKQRATTRSKPSPWVSPKKRQSHWNKRPPPVVIGSSRWSDDDTATPMKTGHELADWTGTWAPAPADWDNRSAFDNSQSRERIERWLENTLAELKHELQSLPLRVTLTDLKPEFAFAIATPSFASNQLSPRTIAIMGDMVPRYWIPTTIDSYREPCEFWTRHAEMPPRPQEEGDLEGVKPWWELYPSSEAYFQLQPKHPYSKPAGHDESPRQRQHKAVRTSKWAVEQYLQGSPLK